MSVREVASLAAGDPPVRVETGTADVFFACTDGTQVPLVTVGAGTVVVAPSGAASLRVVSRIDSTLVPAPSTEVDTDQFVAALSQRIGSDGATALAAATPATLPDVLNTTLNAYVDDVARQRDEQHRRSHDEDRRARTEAFRRARQDIERPGSADEIGTVDELVAVLTLLGEQQGFSVIIPRRVDDAEGPADDADRLPGLAHASGLRFRSVRLAAGWEDARATPLLAFESTDEGRRPIALIPHARGYRRQRAGDDRPSPLSKPEAERLDSLAYQFYAPLPRQRAVDRGDVVRLALRRTGPEWAWATGLALAIVLLALLTPILTAWVLGTVVPEQRQNLLVQVGLGLGLAALLAGAFSFVQYRAMSRLAQRSTERVQPAFWDRVLAMPPSFFRSYSAGDLSVRVLAVDSLQQLVNVQVVGAVLAALFSLVNIVLMFRVSPGLGIAGAAVLVMTLGVLAWCVRSLQALYTTSIDAQLRGTSWVVQLLTGISKVRLAGAEERLQSRYLDLVRQQVVALSRMTKIVGGAQAWIVLASTAAPALFFKAHGDVDSASYLAFNAAFVASFSAIAGLTAILTSLASASPIFKLLRPIMEDLPEAATHRADPGRLRGAVELRDVTFRYAPDSPVVLDRLTFKVEPGEMVALVGPSGSGKSSILRTILGFEQPADGQVLIDGRDLEDLDLDLVRGQMGVVIQNGQITRTSILKNILGGVDGDENMAWAAADAAALVDDIRAMPMKMQTIVDPQLLSGGQAQRILLARALARQPALIVLDEATSALDNISQAKVTESLRKLGATRIVVAHRLSTIRAADRILVVVAGQVVETGTYDELMAAGGEFADLAARQLA